MLVAASFGDELSRCACRWDHALQQKKKFVSTGYRNQQAGGRATQTSTLPLHLERKRIEIANVSFQNATANLT